MTFSRAAALVVLAAMAPASAHDGPPYAILVDRPTGPVLLSVWTDPDVGIGTFHVYLEQLEGRPLPPACEVRISVQPVSERLAERTHKAELFRKNETRYHYVGEVPFDAPEDWRARIAVRCGAEEAEADKVVAVTPPGQGPLLDFVLYLLPFAGVGFLVVRALVARRRQPASPAKP